MFQQRRLLLFIVPKNVIEREILPVINEASTESSACVNSDEAADFTSVS